MTSFDIVPRTDSPFFYGADDPLGQEYDHQHQHQSISNQMNGSQLSQKDTENFGDQLQDTGAYQGTENRSNTPDTISMEKFKDKLISGEIYIKYCA